MTTFANGVSAPRRELSAEKQALLERRLRGRAKAGIGAPVIPHQARRGRAPLSFAQQRIWFLDQLEPNSPLYNLPTAVRLRGPLNRAALQQTLNTIVARHEALRTHFVGEESGPVQVIAEPAAVPLPVIELAHLSGARAEEQLQSVLAREARRPFDLSRDALCRFLLVQLGRTDHALLVNMHHIVSDAWSLGVFFREFAVLYEAFAQTKIPSLPELPIQYSDYAAWQRERLQGEVIQQHLAYWTKQLEGAPPLLELPVDQSRPVVESFAGGHISRLLSKTLAESLKRLAQAEGATLFMTLLAAFKVLLHRYTNQSSLVVGSPIACRNHLEIEGLIGFFVNTLALHTDLSGNPTFREVLVRVRQVTLDGCAHQDLPFERLVEELQPVRNSSYTPLVQVVFVLQADPTQSLKLPGLTVAPITLDTGTSKFDLTLAVEERADGLLAAAEFRSGLFAEATINRMLGHFQTLLEAIVADPAQRIGELPLLTPAELHEVVNQWNDTRRDYPREKTVPQLFEEQVSKTPDTIAVEFENAQLSYRELDERANQLAHHLVKLGVAPGTLVGLSMERSAEMIVALIGILKAGGAYVSLDPAYPRERLAFMLEETKAPVLLTQEKLRRNLEFNRRFKLICLDTEWSAIEPESKAAPCLSGGGLSPRDLAYVSYTSGSAGRPKGVCIPHQAVARLLFNTDYIALGPTDRIAQISNCAFDASTFEIWGALLHGARLVIFPQAVVLSPPDFARALEQSGITTMFVTTALFNQLAREVPGIFRTLRHLLFGGEAVNPSCVREVLTNGPPRRLLHVYGPTETTTFATWHEIREIAPHAATIPIGRPIANTELYVLDPYCQPVPIGVPGELYIGGDGLARGYLNRPELEAAKFVERPFAGRAAARLYRTGDLVRYLPDGNIEFLGRADFQVKIRGFRVELEEIEAILHQHPSTRECVVTAFQDSSGEKRLAAYVAAQPDAALSSEKLRVFLRTKLPEYMVPSVFIFLAALPLNANGKVNRKALPAPTRPATETARTFTGPRNACEAELAKVWEEVLGLAPIGMDDRFFDLGGHSLLAVRLVARIEKVFKKRIPVAAVFQSPTVAQLARVLSEDKTGGRRSSLVEIQPNGSRPPLFFVHGVGGGMFWGYTNLARCLGPDQPLYAFKSRGMDGEKELGSIEEMAAEYLAELRVFQPRGPYYLGGYCFGGNVAYEMARQLQEQGEHVAVLALFNCAPPNSSYHRVQLTPEVCLKFFKNLGYLAGYFRQLQPAQRREVIRWKLKAIRRKGLRLLRLSRNGASDLAAEEIADLSDQPEDRRDLWTTHVVALLKHQPKPYAGHVTLFRTRGHALICSFDDAYGWRELAKGGVTVRIVPGAHESILEESQVHALAEELKQCLWEAQTAGTESSKTESKDQPAPVLPAARAQDLPLSFAQERLWFIEQLEPGTPVHHVPIATRLNGPLNVMALKHALREVIRRHEVLRTTFSARQGQTFQRIHSDLPLELKEVDARGASWESHGSSLALEEARRPFDLSSGPLLRACLFRFSDQSHVLVLVGHQIAFDRSCVDLLLGELLASYEAFVGERSPQLRELPVQYADFAIWQRQLLQDGALAEQDRFWKNQLAGAPALLELPTDHPRPAIQSYQGAREPIVLDRALTDALQALSQDRGCTLFMTLLGAFQALMARYTGSPDIVIGSPVNNRPGSEIQRLIGNFENTLVLRTDCSGDPRFGDLLGRVRKTVEQALAHRALPFEKLVEALQPARDRSCHPVYQVAFNLQPAVRSTPARAGLHSHPLEIGLGVAKLDLLLNLTESGSGLTGWLEYCTDLFESATIRRMLGHFQTLLAGIVAAPDRRLSELPLLTPGENRQLLVEWNETEATFPSDRCIHHLFEDQVERTPEAAAVIFGGDRLNYRELDERANQLAAHLRTLGVGPDVPVGICLERSTNMIIGVLGILKAGGAYVPLDPGCPRERLQLMLENARVPVLLTQETLRDHGPGALAACRVVCLDSRPPDTREDPEQNPKSGAEDANAGNLAYVIHTSGSTGAPKGVAMPHRPLVNLIAWQLKDSKLAPGARTLQFSSLSFDVSFQEMLSTWAAGGTLVLIEEELRRDPNALLNFLGEQKIERLFLPFVALQQLAEALREETPVPSSLREVITAGEQLQITPKIVRLFERLNGCTLHNQYGPSESHVVTAFTLTGPPGRWPTLPPIGRPIANTRIYLLDAQQQPVPIGVPGELYIGGDCVSRGYLHRPDLTAEKFVPDPFSLAPGARLYKTGDRARWLPDGNIEFLGRLDRQVKIRGYRIELDEVEAVLGQHASVRECAVTAREDIPGQKRLIAYVVTDRNGTDTTDRELRTFLQQKLPDYMLPSGFVFLEALPLTPTGKVNRRALPAPELSATRNGEPCTAPRTPAEESLAAIWREVLQLKQLGVQDNFFELGGHSLLAVRMVERIESAFGRRLPVAAIFQAPTIEKLAAVLQHEGDPCPTASSIVELQPKGSRPPLFLVHGAGGGMFWGYANLARHLGTDQPVYAFKSRGLDGMEEAGTIAEMAAQYAADLRAFQPSGPYYLGGYCFGGNVAYEIARLFERQGEKVAFLALFNCWPPNSSYHRIRLTPGFCFRFLKNLGSWSSYVLALPGEQRRELLLWKARALRKKSLRLRNWLRGGTSDIDIEEWVDLAAQPEDRHELWAAHIRAYLAHQPQPYGGHVTLFRTRCHPVICSFDDACGWRELVSGGVTVRVVPGAHESILEEPHVQTLANVMSRSLRELISKSTEEPAR